MVTAQELDFLRSIGNCNIFVRESRRPSDIHINGYFYEAGPAPGAPEKTWRHVEYVFGHLPVADIDDPEAVGTFEMEVKQGMVELTPGEALAMYRSYCNGAAPVPVTFTSDAAAAAKADTCLIGIPAGRPFPELPGKRPTAAEPSRGLRLVLTKKWYRMIESGEKKEEYRELKPYWTGRLCETAPDGTPRRDGYGQPVFRRFGTVTFSLGYTATTMTFRLDGIREDRGGRPEWGAWEGRKYIMSLGERIR